MKVVFVSNYYTHHQSALSEELFEATDGHYRFIQTEPMEEERKNQGWGGIELPSFVRKSYESKEALDESLTLIEEADAVIIGSAPNELIKKRLKERKLVFRYSERLYKNRKKLLTLPLRFLKYHTYNYGSKNVYLLCASAYAAADYAKTFNYIGKAYKWGYFPEVRRYEDVDKVIGAKNRNSILWGGRLIDLKHPEIAVEIAKKLKSDGYGFELKIIGGGPLEEKVKSLIAENGLDHEVKMLGTVSPEKVREYMEKSEIFIFTSDKNEGWGAVLNESMNSACAVAANKVIGSAPYLLTDGENGFMYTGEAEDLYKKVKFLLDNPEKRKEIGKQAYTTMTTTWNAKVAAERLLLLTEDILSGKGTRFDDGPCCKA